MSTFSTDAITAPVSIGVPPLDSMPPEVHETAERLDVAQFWDLVVSLTLEVFGEFTRVRVLDDPEFVGDIHLIFHVPARGSVEEELAREDEWGRRMMRIIPRSPQVYLVFVDYPT